MNIYLLITLVLATACAIFSITRQFQMLQQNSYFPSRYTKWISENFSTTSVFAFLISSLLFCFRMHFIQMLFMILILAVNVYKAISLQKTSIKKLVFTSRIKRLYACAIVVLFILICVYIIFVNTLIGRFAVAIHLFLSLITPVLVYLSWALTYPLEKAFTNYYIKDAKKILNEANQLKVIGITGSYGKTTTKFILNRILSEKYNTVCTPKSFNTTMGVVRTVREMLRPQTQIFICEMGAKNVGDIKEICDIVNPDIAVITSVGPQHLDTFKSVDNVFNTKFELADAVKQKSGDIYLNGNSSEIINRIDKSQYITYGIDNSLEFFAENISYGRNGSEFEVKLGNQKVKLTSKLLGMHSIINITGAVALAYNLGLTAEEIKFAVASLKPTEHRLELKNSVNGSLLIDDAYNANPEGCLEAVRVLGSFDGMKKVIITPGLIELGEKEYECNYALGLEAAKYCDIIIFVGKNRSKPMVDGVNSTNFNKENLFVASSFFEAMEIYKQFADNNSVVLLENDLPDNYLN